MFYYESMFNTALNGLVSAGLMSTVLTVAYGILLASLLFSAYEAWTKGGDVRALGVAGVAFGPGPLHERRRRVRASIPGRPWAFNQISTPWRVLTDRCIQCMEERLFASGQRQVRF
jgi:hypothetical protein